MKKAKVNGTPIPDEAVQFEFDRLVKFYASHGMTPDEVKANVAKLQEKALEQAIGAKLLVDEAARLEIPVSAADVDAEVAKIAAQLGGMENYRKALAAASFGMRSRFSSSRMLSFTFSAMRQMTS